jgi:protein gp37
MGNKSRIEWTDSSWNPVRGCTKVSPGCKNCYASTFAERFRGVPGHPYEQGFDLRLVPEKLAEPLRWESPRRIFVNSMSDLFHEDVPTNYIVQVLMVAKRADWHTYQILTKRSERLRKFGSRFPCLTQKLAHVWFGVSVENRKALARIEHLRATPAALRFLSIEPLLEDLGEIDLTGIGWVIVGSESGPKARSMNIEWARSVNNQCASAGVPFFFKQAKINGKLAKMPQLDGRIWNEMPEV